MKELKDLLEILENGGSVHADKDGSLIFTPKPDSPEEEKMMSPQQIDEAIFNGWKPEEKKCCERCKYDAPANAISCLDYCLCHKPDTTQKEEVLKRFIFKPEEKKCGCTDIRGHGTECTKFKPETTHEKDFIEEALGEFRNKFVKSDGSLFALSTPGLETFLKEKLTQMRRETESSWHSPYCSGCDDKHVVCRINRIEIKQAGRLAMKEEVISLIDSFEYHPQITARLLILDILVAISNLK